MYIFYSIIFICCIELIYITLTLLRHLFKNQYYVKKKYFIAVAFFFSSTYFRCIEFFKNNHKTNITLYIYIPLIALLLLSFVYINIDNFKLVFTLDEEMRKNIFANVLTMLFEITVIYFLLKKLNERSSISTSKEFFYQLYEDLLFIITFLDKHATPKRAIHQFIKKRHLKKMIKSKKDYQSFLYLSSFYCFDRGSSLSKDVQEYLIIREKLLNTLQSCIYRHENVEISEIEKKLNLAVKLIREIDSKYKFGTYDAAYNRNTLSDTLLIFDYKKIAHDFHRTAKILDKASHYKINGFNVLPDIIKKNSNIINYDEHAKML